MMIPNHLVTTIMAKRYLDDDYMMIVMIVMIVMNVMIVMIT